MMLRRLTNRMFTAMVSIAAGTAICSFAAAQGQGGPPPPPPPGDPLAIVRPITAVDVPPQVLQQQLSLTKSEAKSVEQIQQKFMKDLKNVPQPAPQPAAVLKTEQTIAKLEATAGSSIYALLTNTQSQTLTSLLNDANDFREVGIPMQAVAALKLTSAERSQIAGAAVEARAAIDQIVAGVTSTETMQDLLDAIGQELQSANATVVSDLTTAQQQILSQYLPPPPPQHQS